MCRMHRRRDGGEGGRVMCVGCIGEGMGGRVVCVGYIGEGMRGGGGEGHVCRIHRRRDGGGGSCV